MKKVLFATTALVASAGIAAAEANVGGNAFVGVTNADGETTLNHSVRLTFSASVETDAGITFGAHTRFTVSAPDKAAMQAEKTRVTMKAGGFSLRVGSTHGAMKTLARNGSWLGYNRGGIVSVDNNNSGINDDEDNVLAQYNAGSFTVGVGSTNNGSETDIGVKYSAGSFSVGAGVNSEEAWMVAGSYSANGLSVGVGANSDNYVNLTASYDVSSATSLHLVADNSNTVGLGVTHDLGGATLHGTVGRTGDDTSIGMGVSFGF